MKTKYNLFFLSVALIWLGYVVTANVFKQPNNSVNSRPAIINDSNAATFTIRNMSECYSQKFMTSTGQGAGTNIEQDTYSIPQSVHRGTHDNAASTFGGKSSIGTVDIYTSVADCGDGYAMQGMNIQYVTLDSYSTPDWDGTTTTNFTPGVQARVKCCKMN